MSRMTDLFKRVRGDELVRHVSNRQMQQLKEINDRLARLEQMVASLEKTATAAAAAPLRATIDRAAWQGAAQDGELSFHKTNAGFRGQDDVWRKAIDTDWRAAGFSPEGWSGKTILDVGAGSRLRSLWFEGAEVLVLEPLADRFRAQVEWCDLDLAKEVYSAPGEEFIPELEGRADLIVSINALDHGYDIAQSVRNIRRYLKDGGEAFLSFDMHYQPDEMHPLVLDNEMMLGIYAESGFEVVRHEPARRYHGTDGPGAFHYWLRPVPTKA